MIGVRNGSGIWREWLHVIGYCEDQTPILVDKHKVVDDFNDDESADVGSTLDHMDEICPVICSKSTRRGHGLEHRLKIFDREQPGFHFIQQMHGVVYTDYPVGHHRTVDIYRDEWMPPTVIGVRGDKGQVANLFRKPSLLFDDKEENVELVRRIGIESDGILVKRPRWFGQFVPRPGFRYEADPYQWLPIIRDFCDASVERGWNVRPADRPVAPVRPSRLPDGWEAFWSQAHGEFYYVNRETRETTWERPQHLRGA